MASSPSVKRKSVDDVGGDDDDAAAAAAAQKRARWHSAAPPASDSIAAPAAEALPAFETACTGMNSLLNPDALGGEKRDVMVSVVLPMGAVSQFLQAVAAVKAASVNIWIVRDYVPPCDKCSDAVSTHVLRDGRMVCAADVPPDKLEDGSDNPYARRVGVIGKGEGQVDVAFSGVIMLAITPAQTSGVRMNLAGAVELGAKGSAADETVAAEFSVARKELGKLLSTEWGRAAGNCVDVTLTYATTNLMSNVNRIFLLPTTLRKDEGGALTQRSLVCSDTSAELPRQISAGRAASIRVSAADLRTYGATFVDSTSLSVRMQVETVGLLPDVTPQSVWGHSDSSFSTLTLRNISGPDDAATQSSIAWMTMYSLAKRVKGHRATAATCSIGAAVQFLVGASKPVTITRKTLQERMRRYRTNINNGVVAMNTVYEREALGQMFKWAVDVSRVVPSVVLFFDAATNGQMSLVAHLPGSKATGGGGVLSMSVLSKSVGTEEEEA